MTSRYVLIMCMVMILSFSSIIQTVSSFQVAPDPNLRFKQAIEKATGENLTPKESDFKIVDDLRYPNFISSDVIGARALSENIDIYLGSSIRPAEKVARKLVGLDVFPTEYWFHNQIHTFGNTNVFGGLHAACAPFATRLIDELAYEGQDVRSTIAHDLRQAVNKTNACILDLCCGVGMSTRALAGAFQDAQFIYGIDTSPEMIAMARYITVNNGALDAMGGIVNGHGPDFATSFIKLFMEIRNTASGFTNYPNCLYAIGNAERILCPKRKFDLVTIMYAFHEIPYSARYRILREARRLLAPGGMLAIVDICPEGYSPSPSMLAGEPYVLEYQQNIERQIARFRGFHSLEGKEVVPGLLKMWTLTRSPTLSRERGTILSESRLEFE